jgi:hypothetical protein
MEVRSKEFPWQVDSAPLHELLIAVSHIPVVTVFIILTWLVESLTAWVNEIYEGGIEETAKGDRNNRIYYIGRGFTPKERGLMYYWQPTYQLLRGFQLMAIEKEGGEYYIPVVKVRID